jgi:hypothetical protein
VKECGEFASRQAFNSCKSLLEVILAHTSPLNRLLKIRNMALFIVFNPFYNIYIRFKPFIIENQALLQVADGSNTSQPRNRSAGTLL